MKKNVVIIIFCTMCRSLAWPRRCLPVWRDVAVRDILVRPYGLRVRRRRTVSPKASDCRFSAFKLYALCKGNDYDTHSAIFRWIERQKSTHSKMSLTYSHHRPQTPMYKGLRAREGHSSTLTSPSHFWGLTLTLLFFLQNLSKNEVLKRRIFANSFAYRNFFY